MSNIGEILDGRVDNTDYEIIEHAVKKIKGVPGITCEIGIRAGGSSYKIMKALLENNDKRIHIGIDPYGNIEYTHWENKTEKLDYTNQMKLKMLKEIYTWCEENNFEFIFFNMEDSEFFKRFADGIPIYNDVKIIAKQYALVFFDGPHSVELVRKEFDFFKDKMAKGAMVVFDDLLQYPHMEKLDAYIRACGFEIYERSDNKISYIKIV